MRHQGRVRATDEQRYVVGFTDGTLDVDVERLVVQAVDAEGRPDRRPIVTERGDIASLRLRCGLVFGTLTRQLPAGYRSDVIRTRAWGPLLDDLLGHGWPVELAGLRAGAARRRAR